jgi:acyl carrier protein
MTDTLSYVFRAVSEVKDKEVEGLSPDTQIASLELDSLDEVQLMMTLEDALGIEIGQAQVSQCRTLGDLSLVLEKLR